MDTQFGEKKSLLFKYTAFEKYCGTYNPEGGESLNNNIDVKWNI